MGYFTHNSFTEEFRSPLGAMPTEGSLHLYIEAVSDENTFCELILKEDGQIIEIPMKSCETGFFCDLTMPYEENVLFYCFKITENGEALFYCPKNGLKGGVGELFSAPASFYQLTVYNKNFNTPDLYKGAMMYQIFPDRFCSSGKYIKSAKEYHEKAGRSVYLHESFSEDVLYLPHGGKDNYEPDDYFGGDLLGIASRLDYLKDIGVSVIYLNPIFEAASNHRYNTADYLKIDPFLGSENDFIFLTDEAEKRGIKIILDGVFSHTGSDSVYFRGALSGEDNEFYSWYKFKSFPDEYECWWGFKTLPEVNEHDKAWQSFILGEEGVMRHWMKRGASGYRLDVADELPDDVIMKMRNTVKSDNKNSLLLGEVWEDATTKESYGKPRKYALGSWLDSVMNYPLRKEIIAYLLNEKPAKDFIYFLSEQQQNYPKEMYYCLMNLLSSHDVERMRTVLALKRTAEGLSREEQADVKITAEQDEEASRLIKLAFAIILTIPGMPSVYYGDECMMHGLKDPFSRRPYCNEDESLIKELKAWAKIRENDVFKSGAFSAASIGDDSLLLIRFDVKECYITVINRSDKENSLLIDLHSVKNGISLKHREMIKNAGFKTAKRILGGGDISASGGLIKITLGSQTAECLYLSKGE